MNIELDDQYLCKAMSELRPEEMAEVAWEEKKVRTRSGSATDGTELI